MNKDLEEWIKERIPVYWEDFDEEQAEFCALGFADGAMAMAKHLTSQSQTEETIDKFLQLYNEYCHIPSKQLIEFPTAKDYIIKKLNDDD